MEMLWTITDLSTVVLLGMLLWWCFNLIWGVVERKTTLLNTLGQAALWLISAFVIVGFTAPVNIVILAAASLFLMTRRYRLASA